MSDYKNKSYTPICLSDISEFINNMNNNKARVRIVGIVEKVNSDSIEIKYNDVSLYIIITDETIYRNFIEVNVGDKIRVFAYIKIEEKNSEYFTYIYANIIQVLNDLDLNLYAKVINLKKS